MIKLSAVIITFNEENNIERCILSVKDIADEIVVVDSYSIDRTKEICLKFGVNFIEHSFIDYVHQKNKALEKTAFQYVLSLDADEELSEELKSAIVAAKSNWIFDGYTFNRLTNFCGKWIQHCGWYPDTKIRLWDKSKGKWTGNKLHEKVELEKNSTVGFLKGDLLHFSFYTIEQHINQINKFSKIKAEVLFEKGKNVGFFKIILSPTIKFVNSYFFKLGFLDGFYGLVVCANSAHAKFLSYVKLYQLNKNKKNDRRY